jgi:S-adenosylmethionine hydrolase
MRCITLLTDFGTADGYVGDMLRVLRGGAIAHIVDITMSPNPSLNWTSRAHAAALSELSLTATRPGSL